MVSIDGRIGLDGAFNHAKDVSFSELDLRNMGKPNVGDKLWRVTKSKIKAKFTRFTDDEIESFKANLDRMPAKIEKVYGISKDLAVKQFDELKKSI